MLKIIDQFLCCFWKKIFPSIYMNNLLFNRQFGFRKQHPTSHAVMTLVDLERWMQRKLLLVSSQISRKLLLQWIIPFSKKTLCTRNQRFFTPLISKLFIKSYTIYHNKRFHFNTKTYNTSYPSGINSCAIIIFNIYE